MSRNVVVGVTGGIACYKAADVVSRLKKEDTEVDVIMTENACEFVNPLTFRTLSKNPVVTNTFAVPEAWKVGHVALAQKADVFLIAPATANVIGKVANGIADDMLTTTIMASRAKIVFAPAMNVNMYENPILQENIEKLKKMGYLFIEPDSGLLACGDVGKGRMAEPAEIVGYVLKLLDEANNTENKSEDFKGKRILVTAGPTAEDIDPVRYISNRSSGKMGYAIAEAAERRGASVTLVSGPVSLSCSENIKRIDVKTTKQMLEACESVFDDIDIVIKAAAPADYYVVNQYDHKIKKSDGILSIELAKNPDILETLGKKKGSRILVGFAAETDNLEAYARDKMVRKNLDMIVANDVSAPGAGFDYDTNIITIIKAKDGSMEKYEKMSKSQAADVILDNVKEMI
jgi:phosphopantothenoylcysteine decarboxylase/phosphopantothenate--cysteine ligase